MATPFALTDDQRAVQALAREVSDTFAADALRWEEDGSFPWPNLQRLADAGLLGATVPRQYGGGDGTWFDGALILEQVARSCYVTAMAALGEIGVQSQVIATYGSNEVKERYLPGIAAGRVVCSIAITEPEAGSDVGSISTSMIDRGDDVLVNGTKTLISRADVAHVFIVYVRILDSDAQRPIGAVVVDADTPGLQVEQTYRTLGGDTLHEVSFRDCRVPRSNVLVTDDGFRRMLGAFNGQRCLNAAISVGIAAGAQHAAVGYAKAREQGGKPIGHHQGIGWMLADNEIDIEAGRLLVHRAASVPGGGRFPDRIEAALAKTFANEMSLRVTDRVLQIYGGHGWIREMPAERYLRWARYGALGGGTPQIQRNGIARALMAGTHAAS